MLELSVLSTRCIWVVSFMLLPFCLQLKIPVEKKFAWAPEVFVSLWKKRNILAPTGNSKIIYRLSIPYTSHCTEYDTPDPRWKWHKWN